MKYVVILGGSYAGVSTAHRLLKQSAKTGAFKITLVSQDTDFYWNMASVRGLVPAGFIKYPASQFEFVHASAQAMDVDAKVVTLSGKRTLQYDFLVLATGSRTRDMTPFKSLGSTEATKTAVHVFQKQVKAAKTIVVAGAGFTGVEMVGELGYEYGEGKQTTLLASGPNVLTTCPASVSNLALKELEKLKVDVKLQTKVTASAQLPDGQQELILSTGETLLADMYIPTFGLDPNSYYVPTKFLSSNKAVVVDAHLKVKGAEDVWAIGDVSDVEGSQFITCDKQSAYLAKALATTLNGKAPVPYKVNTTRFQIGKKAGTGYYGNIRLPSFLVVHLRKNLSLQNLRPTIDGTIF
ncbi:FAD/NAD(P)-binding domain-containing protein [Tothia fuscella]|uniref:FAD/NAD(P)-binding domain-containing protein n=1 Tax=Tothia fuscella TaxID=1048955 RepID=A0A9P4NLW4_9PEZI|nr:FAD/NAD(P)-binding domain-containing protein [Tothia fuscella]